MTAAGETLDLETSSALWPPPNQKKVPKLTAAGETLLDLQASLGLLASNNQKKVPKVTAAGETLLDLETSPPPHLLTSISRKVSIR